MRGEAGTSAPHLPYTFLFIICEGVHPLRDPAFPEPVIGLTIDITKIGIIILMSKNMLSYYNLKQKIIIKGLTLRHNKFPLRYGGSTDYLCGLCLVQDVRLTPTLFCLDYSEGHGPAVVSDTPK